MLDIGWSELVLIGIVALIVVGPKDLPRMFHTLGRFTGKLRGMAREFQSAMNDAARETGFDEMRRDMGDLVSKKSLGLDALESAASKFEQWDPTKPRSAAPPAVAAAAAADTTDEAEADADLIAELADSAAQLASPVQGSPKPMTPPVIPAHVTPAPATPVALTPAPVTPAEPAAKPAPKRAAAKKAPSEVPSEAPTKGAAKAAKTAVKTGAAPAAKPVKKTTAAAAPKAAAKKADPKAAPKPRTKTAKSAPKTE